MKIYDDLLEHIRRRIQLHEIAGDFAIATESLKIYLDEWEERSKLHQPTVSGQLPLDFVKWYSGMEEEKILKAYERWKNESGNLR
jgi:hypothetical protein